jgi:hypothetical protein
MAFIPLQLSCHGGSGEFPSDPALRPDGFATSVARKGLGRQQVNRCSSLDTTQACLENGR